MRLPFTLLNEGFQESSLSRLLGMQAAWTWEISFASLLPPFTRTFGVPFALLPFSWPAMQFSPCKENRIGAARLTTHGLCSRHQEPVLRIPAETFACAQGLIDDWIVPALVDDFLQSKVHNRGDQ